MAKCPKCGTEISRPRKSWKMAGRPDKQGRRMQLTIGLYDCPKCHRSFRAVLEKTRVFKVSKSPVARSKTLALQEKLNTEEIDHIRESLK